MLIKKSTATRLIFRTAEVDAKRFSQQLGILGKSFRDIRKDLSNGQGFGFSVFSGGKLSQNDLDSLRGLDKALKSINNEMPRSQQVSAAWNANMVNCSMAAKRLGNNLITQEQSLEDIEQAQKAASQSTALLTAKSIALNMALSIGISFAIQGIITALDNWIHAQDKVAERAKEFTTNVRKMRDELGSGSKTISDISDRYERLSKGVDKFGRNISLSTSEYNEYKDLVSQVSDIMPDLNVLYDENGQKIAIMAGNMRDLNEQYRVYQQRQADKLLGGSDGQPSLSDWINDYNNTYNNDKLTNQNFWGTAWDFFRGGFGADITDHIPLSTQEDLLRIVLRAQSKQDVFDELDNFTDGVAQ